MLAESLLFVHNLHQLVVLLSRLSNAIIEDKNGDTLDAFCKKIERQL
jgi:queuine/archaeosine tRNA-ribosyltransferase